MAMHVWGGDIWGISVPSCQFCCKPTTSLKSQKKKKKELTLRVDIFGITFVSLLCVYTYYIQDQQSL